MATNDAFPEADVSSRNLNMGVPDQFPVDPVSSDVANAKQLKEEAEAAAKAKAVAEAEKRDLSSNLTSVLVVSGVVIVAVGVAFFVTKKLKQT